MPLSASCIRREFWAPTIAFAWPFAARAQQSRKQNRIAFVHSGIPAEQLTETAGPLWVRRFYETLRKLGDLEGENLAKSNKSRFRDWLFPTWGREEQNLAKTHRSNSLDWHLASRVIWSSPTFWLLVVGALALWSRHRKGGDADPITARLQEKPRSVFPYIVSS